MIPTYDIEVGVKNIVCRSSFGWNYLRQAAVRMYSMVHVRRKESSIHDDRHKQRSDSPNTSVMQRGGINVGGNT